jgi:hypothetical protein
MNSNDRYHRAKARVAALRGFYIHLVVFSLVNGGLVLLNLLITPVYLWFFWPLLGWSIGLGAHALSVFGGFLGRDWEEQQIGKLLKQDESRRPAEPGVETWPDPKPQAQVGRRS